MPFESLKNYNWNSSTVRPLVSFDWKVYAREVEYIIKRYMQTSHLPENEMINYMKAIWAYKLNRGPDCLELDKNEIGFTGIIVDDLKGEMSFSEGDYGQGYWRNFVSHKLGLPIYKGGRQPKDDIMLKGVEVGLEYLESCPNFFYFSQPYFEADDINGEMARLKRQGVAHDRALYLSTLDGDIQALVDDEFKITWCNTRRFNDRVRGNAEVIDYYIRKEGVTITHPREVGELKVCIGDSGDNLSKGSPLRLFDLVNEDPEYKLRVDLKEKLKKAMLSDVQSNNPEHLLKATNYLIAKGYYLPETPNPTEAQYNSWREGIKTPKKVLDFSEVKKQNARYFST